MKIFLEILKLIISGSVISGFIISGLTNVQAEEPVKGPVFTQYGPVFKVSERDVGLKKDFNYKVIFDVWQSSDNNEEYNRRLESVARYINMHAMNGVKLEKMDIAVILHGRASRNGLTNTAFKKRYGVDNPSLELINLLSDKGVKFYQCGQSAGFNEMTKQDFSQPIHLALSAMTVLTQLQTEGYQLLP